MLVDACIPTDPLSKNSPQEDERRFQQSLKEHLKDRERNPEKYYNKNLAIIPVSAYLAKSSKGDCWVIVCFSGFINSDRLYEVLVWAMDARSQAVIGFVESD